MNDNQWKVIEDFITAEQEKALARQAELGGKTEYNDNYYHGYYKGYLTGLFNLRSIMAKVEKTP